MKFNRQALQQAARDALAAAQAAHNERVAKATQEYDTKQREWMDAYGPAWVEAATTIRRRIKAGKPITRDDLPRRIDYPREVPVWGSNGPRDVGTYRESDELRSLITLLDTVADDEVSSSALGVLGISAAALRTAVKHLAAATARN